MVSPKGLEPLTNGLEIHCSRPLSYGDICIIGARCRTRTCGPKIKSLVLEPTQLNGHIYTQHLHNNYKQLSILQNRLECLLVGQTFRKHKCRILAFYFGSYCSIAHSSYSTTEQKHLHLIVIIVEAPSRFELLTSILPRQCTAICATEPFSSGRRLLENPCAYRAQYSEYITLMVRDMGLEPTLLTEQEPKSCAAASYANPAYKSDEKPKPSDQRPSNLQVSEHGHVDASTLHWVLVTHDIWRFVLELNQAPQINSLAHNPLCQRTIW